MQPMQPSFDQARRDLAAHGRLGLKILTESMKPLISVGEIVEIIPLDRPPNTWDILVFWSDNRWVCHWVMHVNRLPGLNGGPLYITRGLRANGEDLPVEADQILGRVVSHSLSWKLRFKESVLSFTCRAR